MSLWLLLLAYLYNPSDWQHYPRLEDIRNFTADPFNTVYIVTDDAIVELDEDSSTPERIFGMADGLPSEIAFATYDRDLARIWVVSARGELYALTPSVGLTRRVFLASTSKVRRLGISAEYLFLDHGSSVQAINKRSEQPADASPDSTTLWVGSYNPEDIRKDYPLLAPWVFLDERMHQIPYSMVFLHHNKAYVAVYGYGYLVFDGLSWRELGEYQGPRATQVHSLFAFDSSLYAFGENGVDQLVVDKGKMVHYPFDRWGTTVNPTPGWSKGIMDKLRRTTYDKAKLISGNLFLIQRREADVLNIGKKVLSEIQTESWIYDVDFNADSLFVATEDGVFLTLVPKGEPEPLEDERKKLVGDEVLAIVRGDHARYFWTGSMVVKQLGKGWEYFVSPGFIPVPQKAVAGRDSLIVLGGNGGLVIYNPETYFQLPLTTREGLLSDTVTALLVDGSYLWIATNAGLSRFDLSAVLP